MEGLLLFAVILLGLIVLIGIKIVGLLSALNEKQQRTLEWLDLIAKTLVGRP